MMRRMQPGHVVPGRTIWRRSKGIAGFAARQLAEEFLVGSNFSGVQVPTAQKLARSLAGAGLH
jgi:hypothetical protein